MNLDIIIEGFDVGEHPTSVIYIYAGEWVFERHSSYQK